MKTLISTYRLSVIAQVLSGYMGKYISASSAFLSATADTNARCYILGVIYVCACVWHEFSRCVREF